MRTKLRECGFATVVAGIAMAIGSAVLATLALPIVAPGVQARQFDNSAQETAVFLEQARAESVLRNAPVACRVRVQGKRTVLWLDWNLNGPKSHPQGDHLELPRGLVVMQSGQPLASGTIAVFNPRGGATFGAGPSGTSARERTAVLDLSWPGVRPSGLREISMTGSGDFQVSNTLADNNNVRYAALSAMGEK